MDALNGGSGSGEVTFSARTHPSASSNGTPVGGNLTVCSSTQATASSTERSGYDEEGEDDVAGTPQLASWRDDIAGNQALRAGTRKR